MRSERNEIVGTGLHETHHDCQRHEQYVCGSVLQNQNDQKIVGLVEDNIYIHKNWTLVWRRDMVRFRVLKRDSE